MIGIITAMEEETKAVHNLMCFSQEEQLFDLKFYKGRINNKDCVLVKCGVGKVNAARASQIMIDNFDISFIINTGSAGSLRDDLEIGDIVVARSLVQHDFDITAFGHEKGYITDIRQRIYSR